VPAKEVYIFGCVYFDHERDKQALSTFFQVYTQAYNTVVIDVQAYNTAIINAHAYKPAIIFPDSKTSLNRVSQQTPMIFHHQMIPMMHP